MLLSKQAMGDWDTDLRLGILALIMHRAGVTIPVIENNILAIYIVDIVIKDLNTHVSRTLDCYAIALQAPMALYNTRTMASTGDDVNMVESHKDDMRKLAQKSKPL